MKKYTQDKLGLNEANWTYRFICDGKRYTLVKRDQAKSGSWYLAAIIRGERICRSLETSSALAAEKRATTEIIRPAKAGNWTQVAKPARREVSNLGKVVAVYREMCV